MGYVYKRKTKDKETGEIREWSIWWIKYYRDGKAIRESSGSEKESYAKNLLKLREGDVARGIPVTPKMGRVKFDELARDVTTNYQINKKRSLGHVQRRLQNTSCRSLADAALLRSLPVTWRSSFCGGRQRVRPTPKSTGNSPS